MADTDQTDVPKSKVAIIQTSEELLDYVKVYETKCKAYYDRDTEFTEFVKLRIQPGYGAPPRLPGTNVTYIVTSLKSDAETIAEYASCASRMETLMYAVTLDSETDVPEEEKEERQLSIRELLNVDMSRSAISTFMEWFNSRNWCCNVSFLDKTKMTNAIFYVSLIYEEYKPRRDAILACLVN